MHAGNYIGENWHIVEQYAGEFQNIVIVIVVLLVAWLLFVRIRAAVRDRRSGPA